MLAYGLQGSKETSLALPLTLITLAGDEIDIEIFLKSATSSTILRMQCWSSSRIWELAVPLGANCNLSNRIPTRSLCRTEVLCGPVFCGSSAERTRSHLAQGRRIKELS